MSDDPTKLSPVSSVAPPSIPDHELFRCIGEGSYGEVWLAKSVIGQYRAVKIVCRSRFKSSQPFDREFAGIQRYEPISRGHAGLVNILHVGINKTAGYFYYIMELADDQQRDKELETNTYAPKTLSSERHYRKHLPADECIQIGLTLTAALEHLHGKGLLHRDIKPANIIFVNGAAKLADIGLVSDVGSAHTFVGTEGFIPPEGPSTVQADIYALGKVLYEITTGKDRLDFPELPTALNENAEADRLLELNEVILGACQNAVEKRYATAGQMHTDLKTLKERKPLRHPSRYARPLLIAGAVCIVGLIGFLSVRISQSPPRGALAVPAVSNGQNLRPEKNSSMAQELVNVSLASRGATASADSTGSYMDYTGNPEKAIDGQTDTGWRGMRIPGWLEVRFDQIYRLERIRVVMETHQQRYAVSASVNGTDWIEIVPSQLSASTEGGLAVEQNFEITPTEARFIRITVTATSAPASHIFQTAIQELEGYAKAIHEK